MLYSFFIRLWILVYNIKFVPQFVETPYQRVEDSERVQVSDGTIYWLVAKRRSAEELEVGEIVGYVVDEVVAFCFHAFLTKE